MNGPSNPNSSFDSSPGLTRDTSDKDIAIVRRGELLSHKTVSPFQFKLIFALPFWWVMLIVLGMTCTGTLGIFWIVCTLPFFLRCDKNKIEVGEFKREFGEVIEIAIELTVIGLMVGIIEAILALKILTVGGVPGDEYTRYKYLVIYVIFYFFGAMSMVSLLECLFASGRNQRRAATFVSALSLFLIIRYWHFEGIAHLKENIEIIAAGLVLLPWLVKYFKKA